MLLDLPESSTDFSKLQNDEDFNKSIRDLDLEAVTALKGEGKLDDKDLKYFGIEEEEEDCLEEEAVEDENEYILREQARHFAGNKPGTGVTLNEAYGVRADDPYHAFEVFRYRFGVMHQWVQHKAWQVSSQWGVDQNDVEQVLWMKAWEAAIDPSYNPDKGKSIIGWIHTNVYWTFLNLLKKKNPMLLLEDFQTEKSSVDPVDRFHQDNSGMVSLMGGSESYAKSHDRAELRRLLKRVVEAAKELPYEYRAPVLQILDPSDHFLEYIEEKDKDTTYKGAACYEWCNSKTLLEYTNSTVHNLKVAVAALCKKIPELRDMKF